MPRFQWEIPLDRTRAQEREDERAEAIRRLREVEREQEEAAAAPPLTFGPGPSPTNGGGGFSPFGIIATPFQKVMEELAVLGGVEREQIPQVSEGVPTVLGDVLKGIDIPRQQMKRHVIDPVVPTFDFGTLDLPVREAALTAVGAPEPLKAEVPEMEPISVPITSDVAEEAASWVLDPLNLVFFAGPALKGAGGAARVANQIRKTGAVPNFIRAAMRVSTEETATGVARPWIMGLRAERDATRSTIEALRTSGKKEVIPELESWLARVEADLTKAEGRGIVASGADVGAGAGLAPTAEEISGLASIKAAALTPDISAARARPLEAPLEADVFAERGVADIGARPGAQIPAEEGLISSQVLEPPPPGTLPGAPSILSTRLPNVKTPLDDALAKIGGEEGARPLGGARPVAPSLSESGQALEKRILTRFNAKSPGDAVQTGILTRDGQLIPMGDVNHISLLWVTPKGRAIMRSGKVGVARDAESEVRAILREIGGMRLSRGLAGPPPRPASVELVGAVNPVQREALLQMVEDPVPIIMEVIKEGRVLQSREVNGIQQMRQFLDDLVRNPPPEWAKAGPGTFPGPEAEGIEFAKPTEIGKIEEAMPIRGEVSVTRGGAIEIRTITPSAEVEAEVLKIVAARGPAKPVSIHIVDEDGIMVRAAGVRGRAGTERFFQDLKRRPIVKETETTGQRVQRELAMSDEEFRALREKQNQFRVEEISADGVRQEVAGSTRPLDREFGIEGLPVEIRSRESGMRLMVTVRGPGTTKQANAVWEAFQAGDKHEIFLIAESSGGFSVRTNITETKAGVQKWFRELITDGPGDRWHLDRAEVDRILSETQAGLRVERGAVETPLVRAQQLLDEAVKSDAPEFKIELLRRKVEDLKGTGPGSFPGPEPEGVLFKKPTEIGPIEEAVPTGPGDVMEQVREIQKALSTPISKAGPARIGSPEQIAQIQKAALEASDPAMRLAQSAPRWAWASERNMKALVGDVVSWEEFLPKARQHWLGTTRNLIDSPNVGFGSLTRVDRADIVSGQWVMGDKSPKEIAELLASKPPPRFEGLGGVEVTRPQITPDEITELDKLQGIKGKLSNRQTTRLFELEAKAVPPEPPAPNPFEVGGFSRAPTQMQGPSFVRGGPAPDDIGGFSRGGGGGRIGGGGVAEGGPPFEGSSAEEAIAKLTDLINQAKKPRRGQTLLQHEELQHRFKIVAERLKAGEGTPEEVAARAKAALGGQQPKAQFEPVRPFMDESEVQALYARANTFDFGLHRVAENVRAVDALTKILTGTLPQQAEMELLEKVFGAELIKALQAKGPLGPKIYRNVVDLLSLPKTVLTILDHSFPGRQGIKLAPSHPMAWKDSFWQGLRAMRSKQVTQDLVVARATDSTPILVREGETVKTMPFGQLKELIGVYEAPFGEAAKLSAREEAFISRWARLIPGVQLSERAFLTSGNEIRHSVVRGLLMEANKGNIPIELKQAEALANLVNRASGRGTLGALNELAPVLNGLMFAPRYRVSSAEWAANMLNFGNPMAQKEAVKEIISFVGTGVGVLALLEVSGLAKVNVDPTSADFGKGKVGNTRIDFWAHTQQMARAIAMLYEGERQTSTGERVSIGREEVAYNYFRSGLSPFASLLEDIRTGESIAGEEFEGTPSGIGTQAFNRLVPLVWQDIIEGVTQEGIRGGLISTLALGGIGIQTYETFTQQRAKAFEKETGMEFDYNNSGHWAILRTNKNLVEKFGELGDQAQETQDFLSEEMGGLALPEMAQRLSSGTADPTVYTQFREAWEDFEGIRANAAARLAFGRDRDPAEDKAFQAYIDIDRNDPKYKDPDTFEIDYGAYRRDKDAAFKKIDPAIQEAFLQVGAPDPGVARWATTYTVARNLRRDLYAMSKWEGLTSEQSRQLDQFSREVRERAPQIAVQLGRKVSEKDVARYLAEQQGTPGLAEWYIGLKSSTERDKRRSIEYGLFLAENVAGLRLFYPGLYSQASLERIGLIEGEPSLGPQPVAPVAPVAPIGGVR